MELEAPLSVLFGDCVVVNSAEEFARVAENECLKVKVLYIPGRRAASSKVECLHPQS